MILTFINYNVDINRNISQKDDMEIRFLQP